MGGCEIMDQWLLGGSLFCNQFKLVIDRAHHPTSTDPEEDLDTRAEKLSSGTPNLMPLSLMIFNDFNGTMN